MGEQDSTNSERFLNEEMSDVMRVPDDHRPRRNWFSRALRLVAGAALLSGLSGGNVLANTDAGDVFPEFELTRTDDTKWNSASYRGQPKIVLFWATWCPYCRKLMPGLVSLHNEFGAVGLEIVGVNFRDDGDVDAYAQKMGVPFDLVVDGDALAAEVGVTGTPTVFVLDRAGKVVLRLSDSNPDNPELRAAVERVLVR